MNVQTIPEPFFSIHLQKIKSDALSPNQKKILFNLTFSDEYAGILSEFDYDDVDSLGEMVMNLIEIVSQSEERKYQYQPKEVAILKDLLMDLQLAYQAECTKTNEMIEQRESLNELYKQLGDEEGISQLEPEYIEPEGVYTTNISREAYKQILDILVKDNLSESIKNSRLLIIENYVTKKVVKKFIEKKWNEPGNGDAIENSTLYEKLLIAKLYEKYRKEKPQNVDIKSVWREVQAELIEEYGIEKTVPAISNAYRTIIGK